MARNLQQTTNLVFFIEFAVKVGGVGIMRMFLTQITQ